MATAAANRQQHYLLSNNRNERNMGGACVVDVTPGSRCHGNNREREKDRHQRTIGKRPLAMRRGNAANPLNLRCYLPVYLAIHGRYTNNTCTD